MLTLANSNSSRNIVHLLMRFMRHEPPHVAEPFEFKCQDIGYDCVWEQSHANRSELWVLIVQHMKETHGADMSLDLSARIKKEITQKDPSKHP